jgi:hypothetical protein
VPLDIASLPRHTAVTGRPWRRSAAASSRRAARVSPAGSGQSPESVAEDLAKQPELLAAAADLLKKRQAAALQSELEPPSTEKKKKQRAAVLDELLGELKDAGSISSGTASGSPGRKKKEKKDCKATIRLARHMQGDKRGQLSGKVFYTILNVFEENAALYEVVERVFKKKLRWFADWGAHAVECPTDKLALKMHDAILRAPTLKATQQTLNRSLDV